MVEAYLLAPWPPGRTWRSWSTAPRNGPGPTGTGRSTALAYVDGRTTTTTLRGGSYVTLTEAPAQPAALADPPPVRRGRGRHLIAAAVVTGVVWTGIVLARLFVGGAVGMGDQGDGRRLMCQLGVRNDAPFDANPSAFLYPTYVSHNWYGEACSADSAGGSTACPRFPCWRWPRP